MNLPLYRVLGRILSTTLLMAATASVGYARPSGSVSVNPANISFGTVTISTSASSTVTMKNNSTGSVTVSSSSFSGPGFATSGLMLPMTLSPGQSSSFKVTYTPTSAILSSATLYLKKSNGMVLSSVALSGTGVAAVAAADSTPPAISVTAPSTGATISGTVTLSANASDNVGVARVQFYVNSTTIGPQLTTAPYSVTWDTTAASNGSGYVVTAVAWDASGNQATSTGVSTSVNNVQHSVSLSWAASTSTVVGYYVYRSTQTGGPYTRISTSTDPSTLFTDSAVSRGQSYHYVVTAVDNSGLESPYSNETVAQIPQ